MSDLSYWGGNGPHQDLADMMGNMIPVSGPCYNVPGDDASGINQPLDRYRQVVNAYYDIFNNGGCNSVSRQVAKFFPGVMQHLRGSNYRSPNWDLIHDIVDAQMDKHVQIAAKKMNLFS